MKFFNGLKILFSVFTIIGSIIFYSSLSYAFDNDGLILSNGSSLIRCSIIENKLSVEANIIGGIEWSYVTWPSYDKVSQIFYFEAINADYGSHPAIFAFKRSLDPNKAQKVIDGRHPAISFDGSLLAFYRHPNQLWIMNTQNNSSRLLASNFLNRQPPVWISNQYLLFADVKNQLVKLDVSTSTAESTGHSFLVPGTTSFDKKYVLCGSYDGKSISMYNINTNEVSKIKESSIFSMGTTFLFAQHAMDFMYTRQTFSNLIKFNESQSLFLFLSKDNEVKLIDKFAFFGGVSIK